MQDIVQLFENEGIPREVTGNNPLSLEDTDSVWLIGSGRVDVFAAQQRPSQESGARMHVFRAEAGQALFGMGPADGIPAMALDGSVCGWVQANGLVVLRSYDPMAMGLSGDQIQRLEVGKAHSLAFGPGGKLLAIGASFLVNFSLSHFLVFRRPAADASGQ